VLKLLRIIKIFLVGLGRPVFWAGWKFFNLGKSGWSKIRKIRINFRISVKWRYLFLVIILGIFVGSGNWFYRQIWQQLPDVNLIYNPPKLSTKIFDRNGKLLYKFYEGENRSWVRYDQIPKSLVWATIAIEDKEFFEHHGLSLKGMISAVWFNLFKKEENFGFRGGSTITQQLVKNVFFTGEKTIKRKIKEAILAVKVERELTKEEILERYFNQVAYGGEIYGVQEAATRYFGKNIEGIDLAEAAFLAGMAAAPSSYSPYGESWELAKLRQKHVIEEMVNAGLVDKEKAETVKIEILALKNEKIGIQAPHFVFYVKNWLEKERGLTNVGRLGLSVWTSLDLETQKLSEKIVSDEIDKVKNLKISNGAALVLDVKTGEILAMVGSKDYFSKDIDGKFNVTTGLRQPGSSIKPINYLLALKNGKTLVSTVNDSPVTYYVAGQKPYAPKNYNGKYMGTVTIKTALASSLNVPSVKLLSENGVANMIEMGRKMGITTWEEKSRFGLALALGSGEVKMTELAQAYSIFANLGEKVEISPIISINNYLGETIYRREIKRETIFEPEYAFLINSVLDDNEARAPIFGLNSKLRIDGKTVAVKTGTTNNLKDNWCIGWTPSYLVAAWVGNNNGSPMSWVASGISGATPIWNRIMGEILKNKPDEQWTQPNGIYRANYCGKEEYFLAGTDKNIRCPRLVTKEEEISLTE